MLFDPVANIPLRTIAVGKQPHWIAIAHAGKTGIETNEGPNDVSIVDLPTGNVRVVAVGKAPRKVLSLASLGSAPG
ncbi:MAG: hypothetical protein ABIS17_13040 [Casimicrobiaceae bacterium]